MPTTLQSNRCERLAKSIQVYGQAESPFICTFLGPEQIAATAETRRQGGWHGTGDIGYRDADGFIYIVDRKKDMIISGGFNVFPREVEQVIHTLPGVNDCAVIGLPDDKWGEAVTAMVEPKNGHEIDPALVIATCREALGPVKTPKSRAGPTRP
ncbi:AMP-binding enzyme [Actinomadura madurae]|uniref:AMP-binding enzyme n=1 Tax=Actinomadura madurae TaxID=1993 RepID=UPI000D942DE7|nr:AMP-binding protein [Actinomadura madurae]SPT51333.1 Long-chain-fatty-acid--CoA ligase [Actinomadura madurae]